MHVPIATLLACVLPCGVHAGGRSDASWFKRLIDWLRAVAQASLAGPAAASLPAIMAAPALAMGAAGEASGSSFDALSAKMNVLVHLSNILSQGENRFKPAWPPRPERPRRRRRKF